MESSETIAVLVIVVAGLFLASIFFDFVVNIDVRRRGRSGLGAGARPDKVQAAHPGSGRSGRARAAVDEPLHYDGSRVPELEARITRLRAAGREVMAQRDAAQREAIQLRQLVERLQAQGQGGGGGDDGARFRAVKSAFARLYHPDRIHAAGFERTLREQVFKEFWTEIERIEREG